jgi:F-type H+-transporting ATPase subunit alpha
MAAAIQIGVLLSVTAGLFDSIPITEVALAEQAIAEALYTESPALCQQIEKGALLTDEDRETLLKIAKNAIASSTENPVEKSQQ